MSQSLATWLSGGCHSFHSQPGWAVQPETSRRGNLFGMIGMAPGRAGHPCSARAWHRPGTWIVGALVVGGGIGLIRPRVVKMTQMPELVALMHSLVGLAACLSGFAAMWTPPSGSGCRKSHPRRDLLSAF